MENLTTPFSTLTLSRLPKVSDPNLRAWDAADDYLLNHLHTQLSNEQYINQFPRILVINDQFAALSLSLNEYDLTSWSDSYLSHSALAHNAKLNDINTKASPVSSIEPLIGQFDIVLIKLPKTLALLQHQLQQIQAHICKNTLIIAAGMVKHIQSSHFVALEQHIGTTTASLAKKKARLLFSHYDGRITEHKKITEFKLDDGTTLSHYANVFSKEKLDIGARIMLSAYSQLPSANHVVDLGCGNGVLGLMAKRNLPNAAIHFVDESYMSLAAAKLNMENQGMLDDCTFTASDCLDNIDHQDIDLILCNPPFHQQHVIGDHIAWKMFQQSASKLIKGGELWVVGNRHLAYHIKLKRLFNIVETIKSNSKFVVLRCIKS